MSTLFFFLLDQKIDLSSLLALFLVVWLIYTLDHLIDARKIEKNAILPRHHFHQKYFAIILSIWLITVLITVVFIFLKLSIWTIYAGITLFLLVLFYLLLFQVKRLKKVIVSQKELVVAILYTLGVIVPVFNFNFTEVKIQVSIVIAQVFILALINLWEFSFFEIIEDQKQGQESLATIIGKKRIRRLIYTMIAVNYGIILFSLYYYYPSIRIIGVEVCFFLMNTILMLIMLYRPFFSRLEKYRIVGDAIFYIPILLILSDKC